MAYDEFLAERLRKAFIRQKNIAEKHMFGGVCFLLNGNICCGVHQEALVLRVGPDQAISALKAKHVQPFDITGRPMKGWVMVNPPAFKSDKELQAWLQKASKFVSSLPPK